MGANYKYITGAATTVLAGDQFKRICLLGISINKALTGTLTVKAGSTTIGVFAASTPAGMQWYPDGGIEIQDPQIVNASTEDVTVFYTNL